MPEVEDKVLAALRTGTEKLHEKMAGLGTSLRKDFRPATLFKRTGDVEAIAQGMEAVSLTVDELVKASAEKDAERVALTKRADEAEAFAEREMNLRLHLQKGGAVCGACKGDPTKECKDCSGTGIGK